ncbi:MAG: helix-turn-helix domain-containing protein [Eubacteriales bacterium]|nr:helix-turn-helix transcriptional regulator [Clostridiales bacterium]MDD6914970.1 helix-turn-helix domain-containing protein [Eubacteriales bacterium]MDO5586110.1 helix-turn-helix domain-containing protein [Clostridia bacterium]MDY4214043.1 helix-turn-helix domain-containing protein [Eubacteriales bacterium]MDY5231796.1 helix-turn-helix domain-containing protein [Eubacteriales bacterium]
MEQKIKQDKIQIGKNIRRIRKQNKLKQTDMVVRLQLMGMDMTREALVKIERGIQHIYASQLKAIKEVLGTTYDELLSEDSSEEK